MDAIKKLHAKLVVSGLHRDPFLIFKVLNAYAVSPNHLGLSVAVFDQIEKPNTFVFNAVIRGFSQSDRPRCSISFYHAMRDQGVPQDNRTFPSVLKACARAGGAAAEGSRVHSHCVKLGLAWDCFVSNSLIHFYASFGDSFSARRLFDEMPVRDLVSWNALLCGYSKSSCFREVLDLFDEMREAGVVADEVTMVKVVYACRRLGDDEIAGSVIEYIEANGVEADVYLGNTLIDFFGRHGRLEDARRVFDGMREKNIITSNALITAYAKAGDLSSARRVFDGMSERDLISWSAMISGYSQGGRFSDAVELFRRMETENVKPDGVLIACVVSACGHLGSLDLGEWIHGCIKRNSIKEDVFVGNALVDMYSRCGDVSQAYQVFGQMEERDTLSWNLIISGFANNGYAEIALEVFSDMLGQGFHPLPNEGTFLAVLVACSRSGLVETGTEYFETMKQVYGLEPQMRHYGCMVDILGRSGNLATAQEFIARMPIRPGPIIWRILLAACRVHGDVVLAEIATKKLIELDPNNSGNYALLSNTYAGVYKWSKAIRIREAMTEAGNIPKVQGFSLLEDGFDR